MLSYSAAGTSPAGAVPCGHDRCVDGVPGFQPPAIVVERLRKSYGRFPAGPWDMPEHPECDITVHTDEPTRILLTLTRWAVHHGVELEGLSVVRPSLEDAYLRITDEAGAGGRSGR